VYQRRGSQMNRLNSRKLVVSVVLFMVLSLSISLQLVSVSAQSFEDTRITLDVTESGTFVTAELPAELWGTVVAFELPASAQSIVTQGVEDASFVVGDKRIHQVYLGDLETDITATLLVNTEEDIFVNVYANWELPPGSSWEFATEFIIGTISVSPLSPENNKPTLNPIPDQTFLVDTTAVLDISPYADDIETPDQLEIHSVDGDCTKEDLMLVGFGPFIIVGNVSCDVTIKDPSGAISNPQPIGGIIILVPEEKKTNTTPLPPPDEDDDEYDAVCAVYDPNILLEKRNSSAQKTLQAFDLRGYIWDETNEWWCDPFGGAIPTFYSFDYFSSDPFNEYFCHGQDLNHNEKSIGCWEPEANVEGVDNFLLHLENKPMNNSEIYRSYNYNKSWVMSTTNDASYTLSVSDSALSRDQLYVWVRSLTTDSSGNSNSEFKIDVVDDLGLETSYGWAVAPLKWDLNIFTNALVEMDVTNIKSITFSVRSIDGSSAEVLFDDLKTHKDQYDLKVTFETNTNSVDCDVVGNRYLNCTSYEIGESNVTVRITNSLGVIDEDTFTFEVHNTLPKLSSVALLSSASDNVTAQIFGWNDPDAHPPLYRVEWFVDGNLLESSETIDLINSLPGNVVPGQNITIVVTPLDPFGDGESVTVSFIVDNAVPTVSLFNSSATSGTATAQCGDDVTFSFTGIDKDGGGLNYLVEFGDGTSEAGTFSSGQQKVVVHQYPAVILANNYSAYLEINDSFGGSVSQYLDVEILCPQLTPPSAPDKVVDLFGVEEDGDVLLTWTPPNNVPTKMLVCSLSHIDANTDLSSDSQDFLNAYLSGDCIEVDASSSEYLYNTSEDEAYIKLVSINKNAATGDISASLSEETIGKFTNLVIEEDELYNEISLPLLPVNDGVKYVLNSLGKGKGINNVQGGSQGLTTCNNQDYVGVVDELRHFAHDEYVSNLPVYGSVNATLDANYLYKPNLDCKYYAFDVFDNLNAVSLSEGLWLRVEQDSSLVTVGKVVDNYASQLISSDKSNWMGYPLPHTMGVDSFFDLAEVEIIEHFDLHVYRAEIWAGRSVSEALSRAYIKTIPGVVEEIAQFEPGKGYRVSMKNDKRVVFAR
jgi:hypothetical protein